MRCPMCEGGFKNVGLKLVDGRGVWTKHCYQCGGFWFERQPVEFLDLESVKKVDVSAPNYSIKNLDLVCPNDNSLLSPVERNELPAGAKSWRCPDCEGVFYPKGQLGLLTDHHHGLAVDFAETTYHCFVIFHSTVAMQFHERTIGDIVNIS